MNPSLILLYVTDDLYGFDGLDVFDGRPSHLVYPLGVYSPGLFADSIVDPHAGLCVDLLGDPFVDLHGGPLFDPLGDLLVEHELGPVTRCRFLAGVLRSGFPYDSSRLSMTQDLLLLSLDCEQRPAPLPLM